MTSSVPTWKAILRRNFTNWEKLADFLELNLKQRSHIVVSKQFPLNLPLRLAEKITKGTLEDPILRQFLPMKEEQKEVKGYQKDPLQEDEFKLSPKLLHKYKGRALLVCTSACAMHCRYCFRRHYDYAIPDQTFERELTAIAKDRSIHEVLLSGGDPLSLSDTTIKKLLGHLSAIPHVRRIRFHTRFPIGIPERIDDGLLRALEHTRPTVWFVIHCNHPRELDDEVVERLSALRKVGVTLLNQSVLLKGVNDDLPTLKALCERLVDSGIVPYYLHQLDRVEGADHFEVSEKKGKELVTALMSELPGYAVPRYVREVPGEPNKTPLL